MGDPKPTRNSVDRKDILRKFMMIEKTTSGQSTDIKSTYNIFNGDGEVTKVKPCLELLKTLYINNEEEGISFIKT